MFLGPFYHLQAPNINKKATHGGDLEIGDIKIPCYVLEDGKCVLSQSGLVSSLGLNRFAQLSKFVEGEALNPHISSSLSALAKSSTLP